MCSENADFIDPSLINAGRPSSLALAPSNWSNPKRSYLIQKGPLAFASTYERINGGTSRHWLGTCPRFLPADFRMRSVYQQFIDWPIEYDTLDAYYAQAEAELGVSGT